MIVTLDLGDYVRDDTQSNYTETVYKSKLVKGIEIMLVTHDDEWSWVDILYRNTCDVPIREWEWIGNTTLEEMLDGKFTFTLFYLWT